MQPPAREAQVDGRPCPDYIQDLAQTLSKMWLTFTSIARPRARRLQRAQPKISVSPSASSVMLGRAIESSC